MAHVPVHVHVCRQVAHVHIVRHVLGEHLHRVHAVRSLLHIGRGRYLGGVDVRYHLMVRNRRQRLLQLIAVVVAVAIALALVSNTGFSAISARSTPGTTATTYIVLLMLLVLGLTLLLTRRLRLVSCCAKLMLLLLLEVVRVVGVWRHSRSCHDGGPCGSDFSTSFSFPFGRSGRRLPRTTDPLFFAY